MGTCGCCSDAHKRQVGYMEFTWDNRKAYSNTVKDLSKCVSSEVFNTRLAFHAEMVSPLGHGTKRKIWDDELEYCASSSDTIVLRRSQICSPQIKNNSIRLNSGQPSQLISNVPTHEAWSPRSRVSQTVKSVVSDPAGTKLVLALAKLPRLEPSCSVNTIVTVSEAEDAYSTDEFEEKTGLFVKQVAYPQYWNFGESVNDVGLQQTSISLTKLLQSFELQVLSATEEEDDVSSIASCKSLVASRNMCPNEGQCYGIMPWDLSWLRQDDEDNHSDYNETIYIAERLLSKSEALMYPVSSQKDMRILKKALAEAYIEAIPSSRRKLTLVTTAVDNIWKEVTVISDGSLVLQKDLYMKELAWLRARNKKTENDSDEGLLRRSTIRAKYILYDKAGVQTPR